MYSDLAAYVVFGFVLVLFRVTSCILVYPGFSDMAVNARTRLMAGFLLSVAIYPMVAPTLPDVPQQISVFTAAVLVEILIGVTLAVAARFVMGAANFAGEMIGFLTGFQAAMMMDPVTGANSTSLSVFLGMVMTVMIFVMNIHLLAIGGMVESFRVLPATQMIDLADTAHAVTGMMQHLMVIGIKLAAPIMAIGFLSYICFGIFNRLIPQLQVFFISLPLSIGVGMVMIAITLGGMVTLFGQEMEKYAIFFGA